MVYNSIVRPALEYASITLNPWLIKDIEALEKVQRQCQRLCWEKLDLEPLRIRRLRSDHRETYKYVNNLYRMGSEFLFSRATRTLRGHRDKLVKPAGNTVACKNFSHRVIDPWNNLPDEIISAPTVRIFIDRLRTLPQGEEG